MSEHEHVSKDGKIYSHSHGDIDERGHKHSHSHSPKHKKAVLNRLSRAIGHLEAVKRMVESDRDCSEVLPQLFAVSAAINNTGKVIFKEHISHCVIDALERGDKDVLEDISKIITYLA